LSKRLTTTVQLWDGAQAEDDIGLPQGVVACIRKRKVYGQQIIKQLGAAYLWLYEATTLVLEMIYQLHLKNYSNCQGATEKIHRQMPQYECFCRSDQHCHAKTFKLYEQCAFQERVGVYWLGWARIQPFCSDALSYPAEHSHKPYALWRWQYSACT
jgi:hypothetical protein